MIQLNGFDSYETYRISFTCDIQSCGHLSWLETKKNQRNAMPVMWREQWEATWIHVKNRSMFICEGNADLWYENYHICDWFMAKIRVGKSTKNSSVTWYII